MKTQNTNSEILRLEDLYSYSILDTEGELSFDELAILASSICQTPIALVGLMDMERNWFKATVGIKLNAIPRKFTPCSYAIQQDGLFEVQDTLNDVRFATQDVVKKEGIRYYAGVPLVSPKGHRIGTICVLDKVPRKLTFSQKVALEVLAHQVVTLLELRKSYHQILEQQELLTKKAGIEVAGHMASSLCHEISNPLTIMKGRSLIMRSKYSTIDSEIHDDLDIIDNMIDRITSCVRGVSLRVRETKKKAS